MLLTREDYSRAKIHHCL